MDYAGASAALRGKDHDCNHKANSKSAHEECCCEGRDDEEGRSGAAGTSPPAKGTIDFSDIIDLKMFGPAKLEQRMRRLTDDILVDIFACRLPTVNLERA